MSAHSSHIRLWAGVYPSRHLAAVEAAVPTLRVVSVLRDLQSLLPEVFHISA